MEDREVMRAELQNNNYKELQKIAKDIGVKANGKKDELIKRILDHQFSASSNEEEAPSDEKVASDSAAEENEPAPDSVAEENEPMQAELSSHDEIDAVAASNEEAPSEESAAPNSTVEENVASDSATEEKDPMQAELSSHDEVDAVAASNEEARSEENVSPVSTAEEKDSMQEPAHEKVPAIAKKKSESSPRKQFISYNDKDIATFQQEKEKRKHQWKWSDRTNELSKPKMVASPFKRSNSGQRETLSVRTPSTSAATPSKNMASAGRKTPFILTPSRTLGTPSKKMVSSGIPLKSANLKATSIKRRSASFGSNSPEMKRFRPIMRPLTIPDVTPRLEELSRPKTPTRMASPARISRRSVSVGRQYVPHSGRYEYVDTTKMTNAQYQEHMKKLKKAAQ